MVHASAARALEASLDEHQAVHALGQSLDVDCAALGLGLRGLLFRLVRRRHVTSSLGADALREIDREPRAARRALGLDDLVRNAIQSYEQLLQEHEVG